MPRPYPVLLADIGGTYARFAVLTSTRARPTPVWKVPTASFLIPLDAVPAYLDEPRTPRPRSACVAGRVAGGVTRLTNAPWRFDLGGIGVALGLEAMRLVSDYAPLAAVLGILEEDDPADLVRIGPAVAGAGPLLVLGPARASAQLPDPRGRPPPDPDAEASHVGFGSCERDNGLPWSELMPVGSRLAAPTLLSGPSLIRLARAVAAVRGMTVAWNAPPEVLEAAEDDSVASEAVHRFARLLGRFAGDLALVFSATGGIYLAGGIAPRIVEVLRGGAFGAAFEEKDPFREAMQAVPRFVITRPEPAIDGLAVLLRDENRFLYSGQDWLA
ncbi:glucokinase [Methylorubrum extorquens]